MLYKVVEIVFNVAIVTIPPLVSKYFSKIGHQLLMRAAIYMEFVPPYVTGIKPNIYFLAIFIG